MATNYDINYEDERFKQVEAGKQQALTDVENTYSGMIGETDKYYQAQIDASKEWANTQQQLQQDNTDFAIEQIEQQKAQAQKDYTKEQAGAYTDWQKQSNAYGVNAEQMAQSGLANTGYSESSQVSMYNTYQNRVATARESYNLAVMNYNNSIKDAQLQNNSKLAEIAYTALQQQLELSLQGFQYKNQLLIEQANKKMEVDNTYYGRYQDVLAQMNQENALAEEVRQYNENMAMQKQQFEEEKRQYEQSYALEIKQLDESIRQFDEEMARLKKKDAEEYAMEIKRLELQKQQAQAQQAQWEKEYELAMKEFDEKQRQFNVSYNASNNGGSGNNGGVKINKGVSGSGAPYAVNTEYYQGALNKDAKTYGTFENGYQPKGIAGHGKVTKTGDTISISTETLSGQKKIIQQNVWKTPDGKKWYWEGRQNKYIEIPARANNDATNVLMKYWDYNKQKLNLK